MTGVYIFCGILLGHVTVVTSQTSTNAIDLKTQLFTTNAYDKKIRPVTDQADPIEVYINFYLLAINGLDEVSEVLKTTGYLAISWYDEFLVWTPASYGGLDYYFYPQDDVWKPDVALKNSFKQYKELGVASLNVQVDNDGYVYWYPFQVFESTCAMDIRYFPFDVQECSLNFVAWSYTKIEVDMLSGDKGLLLDEYQPNSAWDIIDTSWKVQEESGEASISFIIKMKRKPLFVVLSIILPIALLAVLNIFVFVLPCDSGERAGYAVTVFLALAVFLTIVSATLPANSDTVAVFSIYLIIQTVQSTVITLIALAMLRINAYDNETEIPSFLIAMLKFSNRKKCKRNNDIAQTPVKQAKQADGDIHSLASWSTTPEGDDGKHVEANKYTWKHVVSLFDNMCLVFFTTVFVASTAVCFGISISANA